MKTKQKKEGEREKSKKTKEEEENKDKEDDEEEGGGGGAEDEELVTRYLMPSEPRKTQDCQCQTQFIQSQVKVTSMSVPNTSQSCRPVSANTSYPITS